MSGRGNHCRIIVFAICPLIRLSELLGHRAGVHKVQKIIRTSGFGTNSRHLEAAERLDLYHSSDTTAVEIEITYAELAAASLQMLSVAAENSPGQGKSC